jgi:hypothetical protein
MRGANHPWQRRGEETLEAKANRSQRLTELRNLEALSFALGIATRPKWRGRKTTVSKNVKLFTHLCWGQINIPQNYSFKSQAINGTAVNYCQIGNKIKP